MNYRNGTIYANIRFFDYNLFQNRLYLLIGKQNSQINKKMIFNQKIKFAVLGCGHIGKRHIEMISRNPNCELIALIDIKNPSELGLENKLIPFFESLEDFLTSSIKADIITIATPNALHAPQAIKILENGHHVVIEKPMALNAKEAKQVIKMAKKNNKYVFNVMQNRYSPPSIWMKSILDEKRLGDIYLVELNCYWNRDERYYTQDSWHGKRNLDGGTLFTQFSHFLDILYWFFGDIKVLSSEFFNFNHDHLTDFEDSGFCRFELTNKGQAFFNFSTAVWGNNLESSLTVIGEKGSVKIGGQYMEKVEYCNIKDYQMPTLEPTNPGNDYGNYKGSASNHHFVFENIVKVLNTNSTISATAKDGLKVVDLIERIYNSGNRAQFLKVR